MTVIAWDGKTLAADRRVEHGGVISVSTKIRRIGTLLVGVSGNFSAGLAMFDWIEKGRKPEDYPEVQKKYDDYSCGCLVIENGRIFKYESGPFPLEFEQTFFAIGSGREFATAAMYCGKTAREAVEIASLFDSGCGNGVDVLEAPCSSSGS